jgi:hypothetical protein
MKTRTISIKMAAALAALISQVATAYPIDGYDYTGIRRLDFYYLAQQGEVSGRQLSAGAKWPLQRIVPRHVALTELQQARSEPQYTAHLESFLGKQSDLYGVALLDLSDPQRPIYAEHRGDYKSNVGSVGKIIVGLGLFAALAELYPEVSDRERILRRTGVVADRFIEWDKHKVPIWNVETRKLEHRPLQIGDEASLWEYLDWTFSASSNAAASIVMRELLLLKHFGLDYPAPAAQEQAYLDAAGPRVFNEVLLPALTEPLAAQGIDTQSLRQGSFFTRYGKNRMGGVTSYGTPRELMKLLLLLERGALVDEFTSREIKRLMYMTQRRIRYASHPALNDSAVYFKSGSLYSCKPEPDFKCGKYRGNRRNTLASLAIVETEKDGRDLHYMVVVISNVLRVNSAVAHQTLAMRIHRMIEAQHASEEDEEELM